MNFPAKDLLTLLQPFLAEISILPETKNLEEISIQKITLSSKEAGPHTLFCGLKGAQQDGHDFISEAIARHCAAVLCERIPTNFSPESSPVPLIIFPKLKEKLGELSNQLYPFNPQLKFIGVTGTNGKTSVTHFIAQALNILQQPCGIIGTLSGALTTPNRFELGRQLSELSPEVNPKINTVAMEVSSHALDQNRVKDLPFEMAIFTNISHDHLDYHSTFDAYAKAKAKLFAWPTLKYAVINQDDSYGEFFRKSLNPNTACLTYSLLNPTADIYLTQPPFMNADQKFELSIQTPLGILLTELSLWGEFNLSNALATLGALIHLGYSKASIQKTLPALVPPKGRMEKILLPNQATVIIDYAHTPDALEKVLITLKKYIQSPQQLICVFGCGGDRDRLKRPKMAEIAERYASFIIVTEDNSRFENSDQIFQDITHGFKINNLNKSISYVIIPSRKLAIQEAVQRAQPGDVILLAGKGHETYLDIQGQKIFFDEREFLPLKITY
jgi:UDP-N-acetylmuramoyl-L-alanyl-D-glutamate--2,6-diaminopimelate ligase